MFQQNISNVKIALKLKDFFFFFEIAKDMISLWSSTAMFKKETV